jgi:hypothetical protein
MRKLQAAYGNNPLIALLKALGSPSQATSIETGKGPITYWTLVVNLVAALVPFMLVGGTLWLTWWYVVIHQQAAPEVAVQGLQQLGTPGLAKGPATKSSSCFQRRSCRSAFSPSSCLPSSCSASRPRQNRRA